jgi:hypothetical protein
MRTYLDTRALADPAEICGSDLVRRRDEPALLGTCHVRDHVTSVSHWAIFLTLLWLTMHNRLCNRVDAPMGGSQVAKGPKSQLTPEGVESRRMQSKWKKVLRELDKMQKSKRGTR